MSVDRPGSGERPDERGEQPERPDPSPVDRSLRGDTAREIWAATVDRFQERADDQPGRPGSDVDTSAVQADNQPSRRGEVPQPSGRAPEGQPGDHPRTSDWRGAIDATTPEIARQLLANRTYLARIDIAVEDAKGITAEQSTVDRSLADRWDRFGDARDDKASDDDIAAAYEQQVKRDGPPEATAAFRVGRERVIQSEGTAGLRAPGQLDQEIGKAAEAILTARGFRASADQPERGELPEGDRPESGTEGSDAPRERPAPRFTDDEVREIRESLREGHPAPDNPRVRPKTWGAWFDDTGRSGELASGQDDLAKLAPEYLRQCGVENAALSTVRFDVETKLAVRMVRDDIKHMTVVLTKDVCRGPLSCDTLVRKLLPRGSSLLAYQPDGTEHLMPGEAE